MDYSKLSDSTLKTLQEGKPLDYSKLSNDELSELSKITSQPNQQATAPKEENAELPQDISKTESFLRGAAQSGTLGFADEITGGGEALLDKLLQKDGSLTDLYKKHRDESRQAYKAAETANPLTSVAGSLAGGLVVPMGEIKGIGQLAAQGAKFGGLAALGGSQQDLSTAKGADKALTEGITGAGTGAAIAGTLGALGKGIKTGVDFWKDSKYGQDLSDMFRFAKEDPNFNTEASLKANGDTLNSAIKNDYVPMITDMGDKISDMYKAAYQKAEQEGTTFDFKTFKDSVVNELDKAQVKDPNYAKGRQEIMDYIDALGDVQKGKAQRPELTPSILGEAAQKGQNFFDLFNMGTESTRKNETLASAGLKMKELSKAGSLPEDVNSSLSNLRDEYGNLKAQAGIDFKGLKGDDLKVAQNNTAETIAKDLMKIAKDPTSNEQRRLEQVTAIAKDLAQKGLTDPNKITEVTNNLLELGKKQYLMNSARSESFLATNVKNHILLPFNARGKSLYAAAGLGKVSGAIEKTGIPKIGNTILDAAPASLNLLADRLQTSNEGFSRALRNIANQPDAKRKALMFSLMQQPAFRSIVNKDVPDDSE